MQDAQQLIIQILDIINYPDDKEACANDFLQNCIQEAFLNMMEKLPGEQQIEAEKKIFGTQKDEELAQLLQQ